MSVQKNLKKHLIKLAEHSGETAIEVRHGMKSMWLSRKIRRELEAGLPLEEIIFFRVPTLDMESVQKDAQELLDGIQSLYDAMQHETGADWVEQQLNQALSDLELEKRITYLDNAIAAVTTVYPETALDGEAAAFLKRVREAEEHTGEDAEGLLRIMSSLLPQYGELLQRRSTAAMLDRLHKLDHVDTEDQANFAMNAVISYAAACYIMQKCGETVTIAGRADAEMTAYALGAAAAAGIESSKLMELYSAGRITMGVLARKLKNIFTAAAAYMFGSMIQFLAAAAYGITIVAAAEVLAGVVWALGAYLYFTPLWIAAGSLAMSALVVMSAASLADYEAVVQGVWDMLKGLWNRIVSLWNEMTDLDDEEALALEVEDVSETEDENSGESEDEEDEEEGDIDIDGVFA